MIPRLYKIIDKCQKVIWVQVTVRLQRGRTWGILPSFCVLANSVYNIIPNHSVVILPKINAIRWPDWIVNIFKYNFDTVFPVCRWCEMANCVICLGQKGPLSEEERKAEVTPKGLGTIESACWYRQDDVAERLLPLHWESKWKCRNLTLNTGSISSRQWI